LNYLFFSVLALLTLPGLSHAQNTSATVTTTFSNMAGANGEDSSVVYSDRSGSPILKNSGFIAIGTFDLDRSAIETLSSATDLSIAFNQFGDAANFNATEDGAFQASASGNPSVADEQEYVFDGKAVYVVVGDGTSLEASSEFLVWKSDRVFDGGGPTGGPSEVILSVDGGDLIIGRSGEDTFDFTDVGGEAGRAAFTAVMIDSTLDDHGDSNDTATFIAANSSTSGNIKDGDDVDYFRVNLSEDGNLSLSVAGGSNIVLSVYDEQGGELLSSSSPGQSVVSDLALGTYYVRVVGDENTSDVDYSLESDFEVKIIDLDPASAGSYYGLVNDQAGAFIGHLIITISQDGYYTGLLKGTTGFARSFKGVIQNDYRASTSMENVFGQSSDMAFELIENAWGAYQVLGDFQLLTGSEASHYFKLNSAKYSKQALVPKRLRGRYTLRMPSPDLANTVLPAGDGFACGTLWKGGWLSLWGRSNSGAKFTYGSPLLRGHLVPLYVSPAPELGIETILGSVWFRNKATTDLDGEVRYYREASGAGYYREGFDESLSLEGSKYVVPTLSELALDNYPFTGASAVAEITGGDFDGLTYPVSFTHVRDKLKSKTISPSQPSYTTYGGVNHKNGMIWGQLNAFTSGENTDDVKTYYRGVVLQKQALVSGQAETVGSGVGRYSIIPAP